MKLVNRYYKYKGKIIALILGKYYKSFPIAKKLENTSRRPQIIVSMTSFTPRLDTLYVSLSTLFSQSLKPDKIILYLGDDVDYSNLPDSLLKFMELGLEIRKVENLRSHKKYYYAMKEYPNDIIITVDDDLIYHKNMIKKLYDSYLRFPNCISAMRTHEITYNDCGEPLSYSKWIKNSRQYQKPIDNLFFTSGAGTLFPPSVLDDRVFDKDIFKKICFTADDVWLNAMAYLHNTKVINVKLTESERRLINVNSTQEHALKHVNLYDDGNDRCIQNVLLKYGVFLKR